MSGLNKIKERFKKGKNKKMQTYLSMESMLDQEIDQGFGQPLAFVMPCNQLQGEMPGHILPVLGHKGETSA